MAVKLVFYQIKLIIGLESESVLHEEKGQASSLGTALGLAVCTHVLYVHCDCTVVSLHCMTQYDIA